MAKVRVYELAKELDMDSMELVEKVVAGGMDVKNYMSTLDDNAVLRAKEIVSGVVSEVIEQKRIKSTVIRRRKKIKIEKEPAEAITEAKEEADETGTLGPEAVAEEEQPERAAEAGEKKGAEEPAIDKGAVEKERVVEAEAPFPEEAPEVVDRPEKAVRKKKAKKKKVEQAARIVKRPEEGPLRDVLAKKAELKDAEPPKKTKLTPLHPSEEISGSTERPDKEKLSRKKGGGKKDKRKDDLKKGLQRRRKKEIFERADLYKGRGLRGKGRKGPKKTRDTARQFGQPELTVPKAIKRKIKVQDTVAVAELAKAMGAKASEVIKKLMTLGAAVNINQSIDFETASVVADEFGYELELDAFEEESLISETEDRPEDLVPRPPVVTIMGHVDHGKTSLLDYIRESDIIGGESGGITQHIGAYYVKTEGGDIVFLDTPGHEAFTAMRARGARVTDIIVLVVAADDGVMPQTKEAINHARAADIPMVVAVNKIDKPEADTEKIKRELAELDLAPEEWGGETMYGHISAKTGQGVDELLSLILLQAEVLELKGNPNKKARGSTVEANLDKSKGPVATVLIKNGTLKPGDQFVCGDYYGRVRAMLDHRGRRMKSAGPSMPMEIYGISGVPMAGDEFIVVPDEKTAKQVIDYRVSRSKKQAWVSRGLVSLEDLFDRIKEGDVKELNIVFKADVQGSLEAVTESLLKQGTDEVKLKIIHSATGAVSESDVMLASASGAIIIAFNVRANPRVSGIAERENVDIRYYDVIYNVIKDIRLAMAGLLEPTYEEHTIGRAEVKEVFRIPKVGSIAGCYVTDGHVERNANARLLRDEVVVFDGKIASLRRFKDDVKEVKLGYECGIGLENFQDIKPGDVFEAYEVEEVEAQL